MRDRASVPVYRASSVRKFVRGNEDPAKMTQAKMAPVKRVLGACQTSALSTVSTMASQLCAS